MAPGSMSALEARRQLSFLATFDKKFDGFRRELERLRRAVETGKTFGGRWPTDGLERIAKSLIGAGAVYGLTEITEWARGCLKHIDAIRAQSAPPTDADIDWLVAELARLEALKEASQSAAALLAPTPMTPAATTTTAAPTTTAVPPVAAEPPATQTRVNAVASPPKTAPASPGRNAGLSVFICVKDANIRKKISFVLKGAGFYAVEVPEPGGVQERVLREAPELVIIDIDDPAPWGTVVTDQLALEPLTDYIPVLKISGAVAHTRPDIIAKPVDNETLLARVRVLTGPDAQGMRIQMGLKDPTLVELFDFIMDELRQGTLDAVTTETAQERFRIINEGGMLSSIWSLVGQIRQTAVQGSRGRIRFAPVTGGQMGMMALAEGDDAPGTEILDLPDESGILALNGMRAVVADDDPDIRALFSQVLKDVGVAVRTATDGFEALDSIRAYPPDFIFTDIVMPRMDGWELSNRLRIDYRLRDIPLILLSWKADIAERSGAGDGATANTVVKDVQRRQILARVLRALRPRLVLHRQLAGAADVTGRIERIGVVTLLESVPRARPDCNVLIREGWTDFDVVFRDGRLTALTMTGTDGSFASGERAMDRLMGLTGGRFTVMEAHGASREQFTESTRSTLDASCRRLNRLAAQVTDGAVLQIRRVNLDEDTLATYAQLMPAKLKTPLARIEKGASPAEIIGDGTVSADGMESLLLDLLRAGVVRSFDAPPPDEDRTPIARNTMEWQSLSLGELVRPILQSATDSGGTTQPIDLQEMVEIDRPLIPPVVTIATHPAVREAPPSPQPPPLPPPQPPPLPPVRPNIDFDDGPVPGRSFNRLVVILLIAVLALGGVAAWLYMNGASLFQPPAPPDPGVLISPAVPPPAPVAPTPPLPVAPAVIDTATALDTAPPEDSPAGTDSGSGGDETVTAASEAPRETRKERRERKRREAAEARAAAEALQPSVTPTKPAEEAMGTLKVELPSGVDGPVQILVNGRSRGQAPAAIALPVGLHEITFIMGRDRSLRMVSIKEGATRVITPSF